jgi:nitroimidazol reductase NimA-like FMN-containing flavoprotein (pyridoxamine 5'-phosphate oxidase superfamily)
MNREDELKAFLAERFLAVIATASTNAKPEAAYVAYVSGPQHQLVIGTSNKSRKYKNISENSSVAVVIADTSGEVQYEGGVEILNREDYESLVAAGTLPKLAGLDKYRDDPTQVYLKITPSWIRFITHGDPDIVTEFTEFA